MVGVLALVRVSALLLSVIASSAVASEPETFHRHRILPVPVAKTEPGAGFTTGARGRYVYREPEDTLNRVTLDVVARFSVRGVQQHDIKLRTRDLLGRNEVFGVTLRMDDDPVFSHTGIANSDRLTNRAIRDEHFEADRLTLSADANAQFVLGEVPSSSWPGSTTGYLRGFVGWTVAYDRFHADDGSQLALDFPDVEDANGFRGSHYVGLAWDARDNDWNPGAGGLYDLSIGAGGPWAAGRDRWTRANVSLRQYAALSDDLVLAAQVLGELQVGDVPLIPMGEFSGANARDGVGGVDTGRGYFRRRFVGPRKVYASAELRWEPVRFHLWRIPVDLGFKPFVDVGWVDGANGLRDVHPSGGGGVYIVWDDFEVIRADLGVSPEGVVVVMAADHAF